MGAPTPTTSKASTPTTSKAPTPTTSKVSTPTTTKAPTPTTSKAPTPTTTKASIPTTSKVSTPTTTKAPTATSPAQEETRTYCTQHPVDCITFVTEMSKTECEAALAKPEYVKALQDALTTELAKVIKTQLNGDYVSKHRPSIWCGSLVIQAVVET